MTDRKIAIHYQSTLAPWIEFFVVVSEDDEQWAETAVLQAINDYWDDDERCYGDIVEEELAISGLRYQLFCGEYDPKTDEPTADWLTFAENINSSMPVIEIED